MTLPQSFQVSYDRSADVLYFVHKSEPAYRGLDEGNGVVKRYDDAGELIGITVMDYLDLWEERPMELIDEIAGSFKVSRVEVEIALKSVIVR